MRAAFTTGIAGTLIVAAIAFPAPANAQQWKPSKNVDIVVASGAGGSSDRSARVVQKLLQLETEHKLITRMLTELGVLTK